MSNINNKGENNGREVGMPGAEQCRPPCCEAAMKNSCGQMMEMMMKKFSRAAEATSQDRPGSSTFEMPSCCGPMFQQMFGVSGPSSADDGEAPHEEKDTP